MNPYTGLASGPPALMQGLPYRGYYVRPRFQAFLANLAITEDQARDGQIKHAVDFPRLRKVLIKRNESHG